MLHSNLIRNIALIAGAFMFQYCSVEQESKPEFEATEKPQVMVEAENLITGTDSVQVRDTLLMMSGKDANAMFVVDIPLAGRYRIELLARSLADSSVIWVEDYIDNQDGRTYNISSDILVKPGLQIASKDGSPMNALKHRIRIHLKSGQVEIDKFRFVLMKEHQKTPTTMKQTMSGDSLVLVWSDEFEGTGLPDSSKWTYDIGNWGWGNGELQYYTEARSENARLEDGNLIIEARKNDMGEKWTSARLTTRGKVTFIYGRIEFRAKVPPNKGNWAAGWTLGDDYIDELSWPYCGEIDILESVGYQMDDNTGKGTAHASAHCGAYYFKLGNQPTGTIEVDSMYQKFHTYAVDWSPGGITASVDGREYFTYNDTTTALSWPFDKAQNIILNIAMGGGWGGLEGMDPNVESQRMILDYVRVYSRK